MISKDLAFDLEYDVLDQYNHEVCYTDLKNSDLQFDSVELYGDIYVRTDADRYHIVSGTCYIHSETVQELAASNFDSIIEDYLHSYGVDTFYALADPKDLQDEESFKEFCAANIINAFELWNNDEDNPIFQEYFEQRAETV